MTSVARRRLSAAAVLGVLAVGLPLALNAGSDAPAAVRLVLERSQTESGAAVEVAIVADGLHDVAGFEAIATVDPTVEVDATTSDHEALGAAGDVVHDLSVADLSGRAVLGAYTCAADGCGSGRPEGIDGSARLGSFEVRPSVEGAFDVRLGSLTLVSTAGERIPVVVQGGAVTVRAGTTTAPALPAPSSSWGTPTVIDATTTTLPVASRDLTNDGRFDAGDLTEIALEWQTSRRAGEPCRGHDRTRDINDDGCIDVADLQGAASTLPRSTSVQSAGPGVSFAVTDLTDAADSGIGNGICRTAAGTCSLRAAIQESQALTGPNTITFALTSGADANGTYTIQLTRRLPSLNDLTGGITIDGYTQAGSAVNTDPTVFTGDIAIAVRGQGATEFDAMAITSADNEVRGLSIYNAVRPIWIYGSTADDNRVVGSFLGTDPTGTLSAAGLGDTAHGVHIEQDAAGTIVGTGAPADRNVISGNARHGVGIWHNGADGSRVQGNIIGLSPLGDRKVPNRKHGMDMNFGVSGTLVGGTGPGERNVISGNDDTGVEVSHTNLTTDNQIVGNFIGTDVTGTAGPAYTANANTGVYIEDASTANIVEHNVIGNNLKAGVQILNGGLNGVSTANVVRENRIGISLSGAPIPNGLIGVSVNGSDSVIGPGNIIAYNAGPGIRVQELDALRNRFTQNSIFANTGLGIDIAPLNSSNPNDPGDADAGPNDLLNAPIIGRATTQRFEGTACAGCTVELFVAPSSGPLSGETYLVSTVVDAGGAFVVANSTATPIGARITATATDQMGNTSEFGPVTLLELHNDPPTVTTDPAVTVGEGGSTVLTASGTDPEGATVSYDWDLDGDGSFESPGQTVSFSAADLDGLTFRPVAVRASDPNQLSSTATAVITVSNLAPSATFVAPTTATEGAPVQLSLTGATDPAAADVSAGLRFAFSCDGAPLDYVSYGSASATPATTCVAEDGPAMTTVRGLVVDKDGGRTEYTATVEVANVAPIAVLHGIPAEANEDAAFTAVAEVSDPSGADLGNLTYEWEILEGGVVLATASTPTFPVALPDDGDLEIRLVVSDDDGGVSTATAQVVVTNVAPTGRLAATQVSSAEATLEYVDLYEAASADLAAGLRFAFSCTDASLAGVTYATASSTSTASCSWSDGLPNHTVRGRVIDKDGGATEYRTVVVASGNEAPSVTVPGSFSVEEGTLGSVTASGTDPENDSLTYSWDLDGDGTFETDGQTVPFSAELLDGPSQPDVVVRVMDAGGLFATLSTVVVIRNRAPTGLLLPLATSEGSLATLSATAIVDSPADAATLHYAFSCDGASLSSATYATSSATPSTTCSYADGPSSYTVRVRIMDKDGGLVDLAAVADVANANPTVAIGDPPVGLAEGDTATITSVVGDPSVVDAAAGLGTTWTLTRGGTMIASGGGTSALLTFSDDGTYVLSVTATDKDGGVHTADRSLEVAGVAPTAIPLAPATAGEGSDVVLSLSDAADPSPDDLAAGLRYAFSCTGEPLDGVGYAAATSSPTATCTAPAGSGDAPYTLAVIDEDDARTTYTLIVAITSTPPTARFVAPTDVVVADTFAVSLDQALDPAIGPGATFTYSFDCGSGYGGFSSTSVATCTASSGPLRTVRGQVRDSGGDIQEYTAVVVVHPNRVGNAGFEQDGDGNGQADGWTWPNGVVLSSTAHRGVRSWSQTSAGAKTSATSASAGTLPRSHYRFSAWVDAPAGGTRSVIVRARWYNAGGSNFATTSLPALTTPTGGWEELAGTVMAPDGTVSARIELTVTTTDATVRVDDVTFALANQMQNASMEVDENADQRPDTWFSLSRFIRSSDQVHTGAVSAAMVGDGSGFTPGQNFTRLIPGANYRVSAWVFVPPTSDTFTIRLRVRWLTSANELIDLPVVATVSASTPGWVQVYGAAVAPNGASSAKLEVNAASLDFTMYVDDVYFGPA